MDAIIPFLSWGLKRGEDGWKCYDKTVNDVNIQEEKTDVGTRWIHRRSHSIGKKIVLPTKSLHEEHSGKTVDGSLFEDLMIVGNVSV